MSTTSAEREIVTQRVVSAPRAQVFRAWSEPDALAAWWGPRGFTNTSRELNLRPGGIWRFVMHGPDGVAYPNLIRFLAIEPAHRIVYQHGENEADPAYFIHTVTFEDVRGATRVTMRLTFATAEARAMAVDRYGALEGSEQTLLRMAEHATLMDGALTLERTFSASPERLFAVWTETEHLKAWFGPKGTTFSTCVMDLRPGGFFHYGMNTPDGASMWGKWTILDVVPGQKLVTLAAFSDEKRGETRHPMAADWPLETLSSLRLEPMGNGTRLVLQWAPWNAAPHEMELFSASHAAMRQGWAGTFEELDTYLASLP